MDFISNILSEEKANPPNDLTVAEGKALYNKFFLLNTQAFAKNDLTALLDLYASTIEWDWSGGVAGSGTKAEFAELLKSTWMPLISKWTPTNITCAVDTKSGLIAGTFDIEAVMDGRGLVPVSAASTVNAAQFVELGLDENKKINYFRGVWDANNAGMTAAMGAVMKAMADKAPKPEKKEDSVFSWISEAAEKTIDVSTSLFSGDEKEDVPTDLTVAEGKALCEAFLQANTELFASNDSKAFMNYFAPTLSWEWSGDVPHSGTKAEFAAVVGSTWQPVISKWTPSNISTVVDTKSGTICCTFDCEGVMDGRGLVPVSATSTVNLFNMFELGLDANKKIKYFRGVWDANHAGMAAAMGAVMKAMGPAPEQDQSIIDVASSIFSSTIDAVTQVEKTVEAVVFPGKEGEVISVAEGEALAAAVMASNTACFLDNKWEPAKKFYADTLTWDWSGGVTGSGTWDEFVQVLSGSWGAVVSQFRATNLYTVVDTKTGTVIVSHDIMLIINGRGLVPLSPTSVFTGRNVFEFTVDANKKINLFRGRWDSGNPELLGALGAVQAAAAAASGSPPDEKKQESPKPVISVAEGEALVAAVMASNTACFLDNKWEPSKKFYADTLSWDWSGGVKGEGTWDEFVQVLSGSWGAVVSQFRPSNVFTVVDTLTGLVTATFDIHLIMDARGLVPLSPTSVFTGRNMFEFQVDANHKITHFRGRWDSGDDAMNAALAAFGAAAAAAAAAQA